MNLQQAQLLTQKALAGDATPEEKATLQLYLAGHPADDLSESLLPVAELEQIETGTLPAGMEERVLQSITGQPPVSFSKNKAILRQLLRVSAAASVIIAFSFISYRLFIASKPAGNNVAVLMDTIATPAGHFKNITLPDGTHILLNGASTLLFPHSFASDNRIVYLDGEAFFEVNKDSSRPFIIQSPAFTTKVLGTSFNVKSRAGNTLQSEVAVATGKVRVSTAVQKTADSAVLLTPGEKTSLTTYGIKKTLTDVHSIGAWKEHRFYYVQTPLSEILSDIHTTYGIAFRVKNTAILSCTYSVTFKNMTPDEIMRTLSLMSAVTFTKKEGVIEVAGQTCN